MVVFRCWVCVVVVVMRILYAGSYATFYQWLYKFNKILTKHGKLFSSKLA